MNPNTKEHANKCECQEWEDKYKRARADYLNLERRVAKQQEDVVKFASAALVQKILPILDDLERASAAGEKGIKIIYKNLKEALESAGVKEIGVTVGGEFDPNIMEATEADGTGDSEKVSAVLRKGYQLGGRILRPVQVKVGSNSVH